VHEKNDSNDRALLKFDVVTTNKVVLRKIFSLLANFKTFVTHYNGRAANLRIAQSPAYAAGFLAHI
jgi:hypothetical protein